MLTLVLEEPIINFISKKIKEPTILNIFFIIAGRLTKIQTIFKSFDQRLWEKRGEFIKIVKYFFRF